MARRERSLRSRIHLRYDGRSWDFAQNELDIGALSSDNDIRLAVSRALAIAPRKLSAYVIERHDNGNITVRPEAVFG